MVYRITPNAHNMFAEPELVGTKPFHDVTLHERNIAVTLPPRSVVLTLDTRD